jgi:hypothetical protein
MSKRKRRPDFGISPKYTDPRAGILPTGEAHGRCPARCAGSAARRAFQARPAACRKQAGDGPKAAPQLPLSGPLVCLAWRRARVVPPAPAHKIDRCENSSLEREATLVSGSGPKVQPMRRFFHLVDFAPKALSMPKKNGPNACASEGGLGPEAPAMSSLTLTPFEPRDRRPADSRRRIY